MATESLSQAPDRKPIHPKLQEILDQELHYSDAEYLKAVQRSRSRYTYNPGAMLFVLEDSFLREAKWLAASQSSISRKDIDYLATILEENKIKKSRYYDLFKSALEVLKLRVVN